MSLSTSAEILITPMSRAEAEQVTESFRKSFDDSRRQLLDFDRREGWKALGYPSFTGWANDRFPESPARAIQHLQAAKIAEHIKNSPLTPVNEESLIRIPEGVLRPMAKLLKHESAGEKIREAWDLALEQSGENPTSRIVANAVESVLGIPENIDDGDLEWHMFEELIAVQDTVAEIAERWPADKRSILANKLIGLGRELIDNGSIG